MTKQEKLVIVFSTDDNYVPATYIAIYSIMLHGSCETNYKFYILVPDTLAESNRDLLCSLEQEFANAQICVKTVADNYKESRTLRHVTSATYYRLMLPELLEEDKCLYLDQDILVQRDINEIYQLELGNNRIAGVKEYISQKIWEKNNALYMDVGLDSFQNYINAGVILFNLKELRVTDWCERAHRLLEKKLPYGDQDIVNILCRDRILFLPETCNFIVRDRKKQVTEQTIVLHYAGYQKPWNDLDTYYGEKWWWVCWKTKLRDYFISKAACQFFHAYQNRNQVLHSKQDLLEICKQERKIIIYGSGNVSRIVVDYLMENDVTIYGIAVNSMDGNAEEMKGIPVREIDSYEAEKDEAVILLAVLFDNTDIITALYDKGYKKVLRVAELFWKR